MVSVRLLWGPKAAAPLARWWALPGKRKGGHVWSEGPPWSTHGLCWPGGEQSVTPGAGLGARHVTAGTACPLPSKATKCSQSVPPPCGGDKRWTQLSPRVTDWQDLGCAQGHAATVHQSDPVLKEGGSCHGATAAFTLGQAGWKRGLPPLCARRAPCHPRM